MSGQPGRTPRGAYRSRPQIHAVSKGRPARLHAHVATSTCWCEPQMSMVDLATDAPIYVHREAPAPGCGCSACRLLAPWIGSNEVDHDHA
jgi:hypothetical protein